MAKAEIKRNTTKYVFNIGYVLISYVLLAVTYGIYAGLVTDANFVAVILAILATGAAFFGINVTRVTAENVASIRSAGDVAAASPYMPEATQVTSPGGTVTVEQTPELNMGAQADMPVGELAR